MIGQNTKNHLVKNSKFGKILILIKNFKTFDLLQPLNESIRKVLDTNKMHKLCSAYLGSSEAYMCVF